MTQMPPPITLEVDFRGTVHHLPLSDTSPLPESEFTDILDSIMDYLTAQPKVVDPLVWGQASNGEIEIEFLIEEIPGDAYETSQWVWRVFQEAITAANISGVIVTEPTYPEGQLLPAEPPLPLPEPDPSQRPQRVMTKTSHSLTAVSA